jgi:hypothetical protein
MNVGDKFTQDGQTWKIVALRPTQDKVDAMNHRGQHQTFTTKQAKSA